MGEWDSAGERRTGIKMTTDSTVVQLQSCTNTQWHSFMLIYTTKLWSRGWLPPVKWHQRQIWPRSKANAQLGHTAAELNTHKSQQRFPVNRTHTHIHLLQEHTGKAVFIWAISDPIYASFKNYANHISWSRTRGKKKTEGNKWLKKWEKNSFALYLQSTFRW